jgi:hypothetical protein
VSDLPAHFLLWIIRYRFPAATNTVIDQPRNLFFFFFLTTLTNVEIVWRKEARAYIQDVVA